jgi:hypothetical protein
VLIAFIFGLAVGVFPFTAGVLVSMVHLPG